ncbi:MAG: GNAT family N-acetyltransferase, partial [Proteobacteria bacterium]|nr:GNAT family N-acetyltransferase [Pseudomonadota bacterium]
MECKLADADEMRECFSQVYSQWPHADDPSLHLQRRLASVQHKRASWFVGKINETLVCSLGAYPVQLIGPGGRREARCFGAVFTPEMHRRQGFAAQLLNWVMDYYARDHVQDFLLFSDIDPKFYEKLGFCCLPSYQWAWDLPQSALANSEGLIEYAIEPRDPGLLDCRLGLTRSAQEARWVQEKQAPQLRLSHVFDAEGQATGEWLLSRSEAGHYQLLEANILQTAEHWPRFCRLID